MAGRTNPSGNSPRPHGPGAALTVLIVMPLATQHGGGELSLRHLVQYAQPGVRWVVVFLEDGPMVEDFRRLGLTAEVVNAGRMRQPHLLLVAVARIARIATREPGTLILGWMEKGHLYGGLAAMIARRPAVWYQLGAPPKPDWLGRVATAIPARGVMANSGSAARAQARIRPRRPMRTVYPGAELDRFDVARLPSPAAIRRTLGLPSIGPLIGIVSRLQRWKGVHVLIEAIALLRQTHPSVHCVIVGGVHDLEPGYRLELERQLAALDLETQVTFAGLQPNVPDWMQAMDIVVHASDHEPFGIVVIEAMALGKPVVAGAGGGPSEIVTDGVNGLLVPHGDVKALARALRRYLDEPELARVVGAAARRRAADFSAARYARNVVEALQDLTA